ncbi:uncharacterized protein CLUP02_08990 [Colletotrichum lupini]|uniref:Uncharacterized protein n=1 Tax=Colletotrichum lupini TaxID=145971 RepID=A0A9Q8WI56_9PEZI|nr:uncharacterized protein CLUP02_08990 [Colletotrichum lupini]UQC83495.1 hypothetical protein CLUP02_08990 [Colletotrichum lupini]
MFVSPLITTRSVSKFGFDMKTFLNEASTSQTKLPSIVVLLYRNFNYLLLGASSYQFKIPSSESLTSSTSNSGETISKVPSAHIFPQFLIFLFLKPWLSRNTTLLIH